MNPNELNRTTIEHLTESRIQIFSNVVVDLHSVVSVYRHQSGATWVSDGPPYGLEHLPFSLEGPGYSPPHWPEFPSQPGK